MSGEGDLAATLTWPALTYTAVLQEGDLWCDDSGVMSKQVRPIAHFSVHGV